METVMVSKDDLRVLQDQLSILRLKVQTLETESRKRDENLLELKNSFWRDRQDVWTYISDTEKEAKRCKTSKK